MKQNYAPEIAARDFPAEAREMAGQLASGSFAPALKECVELAQKSIGENFAAAAAPNGNAWPARKKIDDGHPLLIDTGKLFQAATSDFGEGHIEQIGDRGAFTGIDSNEVPYAATHNFGDPGRNIPQREFEDVSEAAKDEMAEAIAERGLELLMGF